MEEQNKIVDRGKEELRALLEKNLELNSEIYKMVKGIKRYVLFQQTMSIVKIVFFVVLISVGFVYLPPLLGQAFGYYRELLGSLGVGGEAVGGLPAIDLDSVKGLINKNK